MAEDEVERARLAFLGGMAAVVELLREKASASDSRAILQAVIQAAASLRTMRTEEPPRLPWPQNGDYVNSMGFTT